METISQQKDEVYEKLRANLGCFKGKVKMKESEEKVRQIVAKEMSQKFKSN